MRVLAWDHPRATLPLAACSRAWAELTGRPFEIDTRSLSAFGDETPAPGQHDLVLIDHPHLGRAAAAGSIVPLDDLLGEARLAELAAAAVGPPGVYRFDGSTWATAVDAACQALAYDPAALGEHHVPTTWNDVLALAAALPGRVALPLHPAHAISSLLSLLAARGEQAGGRVLATGASLVWAVTTLAGLVEEAPGEAFAWEPPEALALLSCGELACIPLTYAYVGFPVTWSDAPRVSELREPGSILGGVGAAVLAGTDDPVAAAALAAWLASPDVQRDIVGPAHGQPAASVAWDDPQADPMLAAIRGTIDASRVRPRDPWWPGFQLAGGELLGGGLRARRDPVVLAHELEQAYADHWGSPR